jgi:hypothetical protein
MDALGPHLDHTSGVILVAPVWDGRRREWVERIRKSGVGCKVVIISPEETPEAVTDPDVRVLTPKAVERAARFGQGLML